MPYSVKAAENDGWDVVNDATEEVKEHFEKDEKEDAEEMASILNKLEKEADSGE